MSKSTSFMSVSPYVRNMVLLLPQISLSSLKEALSKVLVPYYPLAGRLKESSDGVLQLACTGEGAWFMEASANYSLDSVNYFNNVFMNLHTDLLPTPAPEFRCIDLLVQFQLIHFTCEGFVLGFKLCHTVLDGLGVAQFLNAIGEFARGFLHPTIAPIWYREAIPAHAWLVRALGEIKVPPPPPPSLSYQLEHASIHTSLEEINKLKNDFFEFSGIYCSTYGGQLIIHAVTPNARKFLDSPLPEGYYGNLLHQVTVTIASGLLVEA
ncbi:hypothetical protein AQUCO_12300004v1 [Aquilegia coerulea]|uniref:Uncharacterized protein n=1 Tax=Aquilegia coerulea TaxID=218851 RepID=A0A2G5C1J8_AQUCA|nr:hypothetical protein AQUCO_12300004v1 [Aquilegia coerulea]